MELNKIELIKKLVKSEIENLNTFRNVRYAFNNKEDTITRVSFESIRISNFLNENDFTKEMKLFYLNELKNEIINKKIEIYDNLPHSTPNVTKDFIRWIDKSIIKIELDDLRNESESVFFFKERRYYNYFIFYLNNHIVEPYQDISYLFQRMLNEKFINKITHKNFMKWLKEQTLIDETIYKKLNDEGQFRSLDKSFSNQRENNFNNVFNLK